MKTVSLKSINKIYLYFLNPAPAILVYWLVSEVYCRFDPETETCTMFRIILIFGGFYNTVFSYVFAFIAEAWIKYKSSRYKWLIRLACIAGFNLWVFYLIEFNTKLFLWFMPSLIIGQIIIFATAYGLLKWFRIEPGSESSH